MYTDPSLQLHEALWLYKTSDTQTEGLGERGGGRGQIRRNGRLVTLRSTVRAATVKAMHSGDGCGPEHLEQLGGEFIFGPGYVEGIAPPPYPRRYND